MKKHLIKSMILVILAILCIGTLSACDDGDDGKDFSPAKNGILYNLQEAYEQGLVTKQDLVELSQYIRTLSDDGEDIFPTKVPEAKLNPDIEMAIRQTYAYDMHYDTLNYVSHVGYYGTYSGLYAVRLKFGGFCAGAEPIVAGIKFPWPYYGDEIFFWGPLLESDNDKVMFDGEAVKKGDFYTLQEAYDQNLLSSDDLKNISYYNIEKSYDDFEPAPLNPAELSEDIEMAIKQTYAYELRYGENADSNADISEINLGPYYGTYNGMYAVKIRADRYRSASIFGLEIPMQIGDAYFCWTRDYEIVLWKSIEEYN